MDETTFKLTMYRQIVRALMARLGVNDLHIPTHALTNESFAIDMTHDIKEGIHVRIVHSRRILHG